MSAKEKFIKSDLARLDNMTDADIDYSDIPPLDADFFGKATITLPKRKDSITLRLDHEVLSYFKRQGKGYQTFINAVLKTYVESQEKQDRA